jgi:hypothetical protein
MEYRGIDGDDGDFALDGGGDVKDDIDGKDAIDGHGSSLNQSSTTTPSFDTPSKTPETVSSKRTKDDVSSSEVEEGELPDSPEPAKKKLKGQHTYFEEPKEW